MKSYLKYSLCLICYFIFTNFTYSLENKILFKINNEIITSIDILNETNYLSLLNEDLEKLDKNQIYEISKNSIIRDKIKEIALNKSNKNLNLDQEYVDEVMLRYFKKINLNSMDQINKALKSKGLKLDKIQKKITIQLMWNELIFKKYSKNIKIDKNIIRNQISKKQNQEEYLVSEIVFNVSDKKNIELQIKKIENEIQTNGFKNAAVIHSISDTAINGGNLGWIKENSLSKKIRDELEKIQIGEITPAIQIPGAFIILKIENKRTSFVNLNTDEEFNKIVKIQTNEQLNQFSNIYFNRIKKNTIIDEL